MTTVSLRDQISNGYKEAMHARDQAVVSAMRLIMSSLKDKDINSRPRGIPHIPDSEILAMLQAMIKQRRESIVMYEQGNRPELAAKEQSEITVIERFLPQQMDEAEIAAVIEKHCTALGASSIKDMGKVMAELKANYSGQMDFALVGSLLKKRLGG